MDTPSISSCHYASTSIDPQIMWGGADGLLDNLTEFKRFQSVPIDLRAETLCSLMKRQQNTETTAMPNTPRRIVQVFIADPNDNVPLDQSVLFKGEQKLTDLTDTELFFEVPIAETLKAHNEKRVKWLDKEASKRAGKDVVLDPVKIRDLKMVVVTVAQF